MTPPRTICRLCGRRMRPIRARLADHPGTVGQRKTGVCTGCFKAQPVASTSKEAQTIANTPANRESLAAYLRWRAPYRLKAGNP